MVEWWLGWSATPPDAREQLLELGLVPDDVPTLTGMTSSVAPPEVAGVEVRRVETAAEYAETIEIDWEVWQLSEEERAARRAVELDRWEQVDRAGVVHHYAAFVDGVRVGFGRAIDMVGGVGLFGGAVLPGGAGTRRLPRARPRALGARGRARHAAPRRAGGSHVRPGPDSTRLREPRRDRPARRPPRARGRLTGRTRNGARHRYESVTRCRRELVPGTVTKASRAAERVPGQAVLLTLELEARALERAP